MPSILLALAPLLACSSGSLEGDCPDGQVLDDAGECVDEGGGDGGADPTGDGGSGDGGSGDGGASDGGASDGGGGDGGGDGGGEDCTAMVIGTDPADSAADVSLATRVEFTLSEGDPGAAITLATLDGTSVAGTTWTEAEDERVVFEPSGPLQGATTYVATLDWCGGTDTLAFVTEDPGDPVTDLVGRSYAVDLASATWVEPAGVGDLISGSLDGELLLGVAAQSAASIEIFGTLGTTTGEQDTCEPTIDFPPADFSENPFFQLGPSDVAFEAAGYTVPLSNLKLAGSFNEDGSRIVDATMSAEVDVRDLGELIDSVLGTSDPDDICGLLIFLGVSCDDCSGDGASYCLGVLVEDVDAAERSGSLEDIAEADCHPDCAASYSNPDCDTSGW